MFESLLRGESAIRHLSLVSDAGSFEIVGAQVPHQSWDDVPQAQRVLSDRVSLYALVAADAAIRSAVLDTNKVDPTRFGVSVGTSLGGTLSQETAYADVFKRDSTRLSPFTLVRVMYNGPSALLGLRYRIEGPNLTYTTTCSSSAVSIGEALRQIQHGHADVMLAGGSEALFSFVSIKAWLALQVLAPERRDNPGASCRPFCLDRNGTVLGDGAAFVVLEEFDHAFSRGAPILAELSGYGICNDSSHMTQPSVTAQARAMRLALSDAGVSAADIDYVNAHGTGTQLNDVTETEAIKQVFGAQAARISVSSTKSMHGHLVGASGALELVISVLSVARDEVPPTAHLDHPDPKCDLDYVPHRGRSTRVRAAISNSFAVGGTAATLLVRKAA